MPLPFPRTKTVDALYDWGRQLVSALESALSGVSASAPLDGDPVFPLDPATKAYVDQVRPNGVLRKFLIAATWENGTNPVNDYRSIAWSPELGLAVMVGRSNTGTTDVATSEDGVTWTGRASPAGLWNTVCWAPKLRLFVAGQGAGSGLDVMTSPDGITWTSRVTPARQINTIVYSPELELLVAVCLDISGADVLTSPDGSTWTARATAAGKQLLRAVWSPNLMLFVAAGNQVSGHDIQTSPDGLVWTLQSNPAQNAVGVAWSEYLGLFAIVGMGGAIMTSPDGKVWTTRTSPTAASWRGVCWSPRLGMFVAVGVLTGATVNAMYSVDGVNWIAAANFVPVNGNKANITWADELGMFLIPPQQGAGGSVIYSPSAYNYPWRS